MIPEHLRRAIAHLRKIDPKTEALFTRPRSTDNFELLRKHDLGVFDGIVQRRSPGAVDCALDDIGHYWGSLTPR
jgi:hypothetical protein